MSRGTYLFQDTFTIKDLIDESYARCGLNASIIEGYHLVEARRSLNLMFSHWSNSFNVFTQWTGMIQLVPGQAFYTTPEEIVDISVMTCSNITRVLQGIPYSSSGGDAAAPFSNDPSLTCVQSDKDGYISYEYSLVDPQEIYYVGVISGSHSSYTLNIDYSFYKSDDVNNKDTWVSALRCSQQEYLPGQIYWFVLPCPPKAIRWRIQETGGETLNINKIYFCIPNQSVGMQEITVAQWLQISNKSTPGNPNSYVFDRQKRPPITLYPTPTFFDYPVPVQGTRGVAQNYTHLIYKYRKQVMDIYKMSDNFEIPQSFFDAAAAGLAARLSLKFAPDKFQLLNGIAEATNLQAMKGESVNLPITFTLTNSYNG